MSIPGPQVHRQLISASNECAARLEQLRGQQGQIEQQRDDLEDQREQTLSKLAEFYLPDLTRESVQQTCAEIRPALRELLLRKQGRVLELQSQLEGENHLRTQLENEFQELNERLDRAEDRQDEVATKVEKNLQEQPDFVDLSKRAAMAEVALQRAQENLDEISQDAAKKLPAYNNCSLFSYLKKRHFGTSEYTHRGFTRTCDRWLAQYIGYRQAKQNYDYLKNTPGAMQKIIAEDRIALDTVLDELQKKRDHVAEQLGLPAQVKAVESFTEQRKTALANLNTATSNCEATQSLLNHLEGPKCEFHAEAIELFRGMLAEKQSDQLRREARQTPEITDDQIVASLRGIASKLDQNDLSTARHQDELDREQDIYHAIGRLVQRFRASGYDRSRCEFPESLDVAGSLDQARSTSDVDALWDSIRRTQSWGPTTMDKITSAASHPMTEVMVNAMAHSAEGTMSEHARRAGKRTNRRR